jgi:hypothetical protein
MKIEVGQEVGPEIEKYPQKQILKKAQFTTYFSPILFFDL